MNEPTIVRTFTDRGEAEIARALLEAEGITASVTADDMGGATPSLDFTSGANLIVAADDVERAQELLDELVTADDLDAAERETE